MGCAGTRGVPRRGEDRDQPEAGGGVRHRAAEAVQARHQAAAPAAGLCTEHLPSDKVTFFTW